MTTFKVFGCSACLVAAIELRDEAKMRRMLADPNVEYKDTVWLPIQSPFKLVKTLSNYEDVEAELLSAIAAESVASVSDVSNSSAPKATCEDICPHPISVPETLITDANVPESCAVSVVMMALLYSTTDFNALQILIDSGQFDLREPLIFHLHYDTNSLAWEIWDKEWALVVVSPLGIALLIDALRIRNQNEENEFLLIRTFLDARLASLDDDFIAMRCYDSKNCTSFRTKGAISFLSHCWSYRIAFDCFRPFIPYGVRDNLSVIEMFCDTELS